MNPSALRISIIGSGNVATHIARRLLEQSVKIVQICSKNLENAQLLAAQVNAQAICQLGDLDTKSIDFVWVLSNDDALATIAPSLPKNTFVVHSAGAKGLSVFEQQQHAAIIYPLYSFSKNVPVHFDALSLFLCVKQKEDAQKIESWARLIAPSTTWVTENDLLRLHTAAVIACNFSNFMFTLANELLAQSEIPFSVLQNLLVTTVEKAVHFSPFEMQTGPAKRGDAQTLAAHQKILLENPEILAIYNYLSEKIHTLYAKKSSNISGKSSENNYLPL